MRFAFFLLTILIAGGAIWVTDVMDADVNRAERQVKLQRALAENGIRKMLWGWEEYDFFDIVVGETSASGDLTFRGMITQSGGASLAYGHARRQCEDRAGDPTCWSVSYLEIDGRAAVSAAAVRDQ